MTIRGGGKPRRLVGRAPGLAPDGHRIVDPDLEDAYASDAVAEPEDGRPTPAYEPRYLQSRRRHGARQLMQFGLFALVLCGLVVGGLVFVVRPIVVNAIVDWAAENQTALSLPIIPGIVRGELNAAINTPAGTDATPISFMITTGETPKQVADALLQAGLLKDDTARRAFVFDAIDKDAASSFMAGTHTLNKTMTPDQIVAALQLAPPAPPVVRVTFREGLRLEQLVAKLESVEANAPDAQHKLTIDVQEFYNLAKNPPATLTSKYTWLKQGVSLEGFLFPATYDLTPATTADQLISKMLAAFAQNAPPDLLSKPADDVYRIVTLASLVEPEVANDTDRALVAGVYTNRLDKKKWPTGLLNSNPSVTYAKDSLWLSSNPIADWVTYTFWVEKPGDTPFNQLNLPPNLAGYNTYRSAGLPPGPLLSPGLSALTAAMNPNTKDGYLYFLAAADGKVYYAHTQAEQDANAQKYGVRQ